MIFLNDESTNLNSKKFSATISAVTATYNCAHDLPRLIASLRAQTDRDFQWVVMDGGSTDGTLELLHAAGDVVSVLVSEPDFGIYDAINKAVRKISNQYYLVLGADDFLYPDAVALFKQKLRDTNAEIVTAKVKINGRVSVSRRPWPWLYCQSAYIEGHAVSALIKKDLHERFGFYSNRLPIAADQLFIKKAGDAGIDIVRADFVSGEYGPDGFSGVDVVGALTENFRVQITTGENKVLQLIVFFIRLIKNYKRW